MKPGIKTTEFWVSAIQGILGPVIAILIVAGVLSPDIDPETLAGDVSMHIGTIVEAAVALFALWKSAKVVQTYTASRTEVKMATNNAPATLAAIVRGMGPMTPAQVNDLEEVLNEAIKDGRTKETT